MKRTRYEQEPSVLVLESTGKWETAIKQVQPDIRVQPVADLETLANGIRRQAGVLAIIEIDTELPQMIDRLKFVGFHASHPLHPCFIGVVDDRLSGLSKEICQFGFCEVLDNLFQANRLVKLLDQSRRSIDRPFSQIERRVQGGLPWAPVNLSTE
ncbi:MAG: hypothetical protein MK108_01475 [Mariniblastus sp.]|nr:hypothetical protein [Mariniblastus sp.]